MAGAYLNYFTYDESRSDLAMLIERSITDITVPDGVGVIGPSAFKECKALRKITIPDTVTKISGYAFHDCTALTELIIPDSVTELGNNMCHGCTALTRLVLSDNVAEIPRDCFYQVSKVNELIMPSALRTIEANSLNISGCLVFDFTRCREIPTLSNINALYSINEDAKIYLPPELYDDWAVATNWVSLKQRLVCRPSEGLEFARNGDGYEVVSTGTCQDRYVSIPSVYNNLPVKILGCIFAYYGEMEGIIIPEGVTIIESSSIQCCSNLKALTLPDSLESIRIHSIAYCESLERVSFGKNLKDIGGWCFYNNYSCKVYDFTRCTRVPELYWYIEEGDTFYNLPSDARFIVPSALLDEWRSATNWSYFADKIVAG